MKPRSQAAALFNGKFHKFRVGGGRGDGEHTLAHTGDGQHGALSGNVLEADPALGSRDPEGLDVGGIDAHVGDDTDVRDQGLVCQITHDLSPPGS